MTDVTGQASVYARRSVRVRLDDAAGSVDAASAARTASIWTGTRTWRAFSPSRSSSSATRRSSRRFAGDSRRTGRGGQGGDHRRRTALRAGSSGWDSDGLCADPGGSWIRSWCTCAAQSRGREPRRTRTRRAAKTQSGHTFGHAVEKCSREMIHGEAVAVGDRCTACRSWGCWPWPRAGPHRAAACGAGLRDRISAGAGRTIACGRD